MGPQSAKSFAGQKPVHAPEPDKPAERARQEIDYGRRGSGYIFGAFRPATGEAFTFGAFRPATGEAFTFGAFRPATGEAFTRP